MRKSNIVGFIVLIIIVGFALLGLSTRVHAEKNSHLENATVISIQRYDTQIVRLETADGNLWEVEFDLDDPIDIGDKAIVTFKNDGDLVRENDIIIDVIFEE